MGLFAKFQKGFEKSRGALWQKLGRVFQGSGFDESTYEAMEEALIASDVGVDTSLWLISEVKKLVKEHKVTTPDGLPELLQLAMEGALSGMSPEMHQASPGTPALYLFVGVNGVGKTTSIGKLAHYYKQSGRKVLLAAGDTFRAAAVDQLVEWGVRAGCDVVRHNPGADPAAVVYDAVVAAKARGIDVVLCDTAGRLHNKAHLMAELSKIHKVAARELPGAPHEVLLVVDGTTGQNAIKQAEAFREAVSVSGIIITKLDGTARGGVILPIVREYQIPVKWVGLGEQIDDLEPFDAHSFASAICEP